MRARTLPPKVVRTAAKPGSRTSSDKQSANIGRLDFAASSGAKSKPLLLCSRSTKYGCSESKRGNTHAAMYSASQLPSALAGNTTTRSNSLASACWFSSAAPHTSAVVRASPKERAAAASSQAPSPKSSMITKISRIVRGLHFLAAVVLIDSSFPRCCLREFVRQHLAAAEIILPG